MAQAVADFPKRPGRGAFHYRQGASLVFIFWSIP
jgi:hypothetical protein